MWAYYILLSGLWRASEERIMMGNENKELICSYLCEALKLTRHCEGLKELNYFPGSEEVIAIWESGRRSIINVACDSGIAMLQDVIRAMSI